MPGNRSTPSTRRRALAAGGAFALGVLSAGRARAAWPAARPIRVVIGFAPGGAADYVARTLSEPLARALGQAVVVENRAGAGSSLAADFVAKAQADGYTILIASPSSISVNPALNPKLTYAKDLLPVTKLTSSPLVIAVHPDLPVRSTTRRRATARRRTSAPRTSAP